MAKGHERLAQDSNPSRTTPISDKIHTRWCGASWFLRNARTISRTILVACDGTGHSLVCHDLSLMSAQENTADLDTTNCRDTCTAICKGLHGHNASHTVSRIQVHHTSVLLAHALARMGHASQRNREVAHIFYTEQYYLPLGDSPGNCHRQRSTICKSNGLFSEGIPCWAHAHLRLQLMGQRDSWTITLRHETSTFQGMWWRTEQMGLSGIFSFLGWTSYSAETHGLFAILHDDRHSPASSIWYHGSKLFVTPAWLNFDNHRPHCTKGNSITKAATSTRSATQQGSWHKAQSHGTIWERLCTFN